MSCSKENDHDGVKCVPCSTLDKSAILSNSEVETRLDSMSLSPTWKLVQPSSPPKSQQGDNDGDGKEQQLLVNKKPKTDNNDTNPTTTIYPTTCPCITRSFVAKNFQAAIQAINDMGVIAEREGHHPNFHLTNYRNVDVVIYTHNVQGITVNDLILAQLFDKEVKIVYSPKWLKSNPHVKDSATSTTAAAKS